MKEARMFGKAIGFGLAARAVLLSFVIGAAALACAQSGAMTPYQGESDGVSAGGKWLEFHSTDKMTGAKKVRFEIQSNNYFEDNEYKPRVNLYCNDGKLKLARVQQYSVQSNAARLYHGFGTSIPALMVAEALAGFSNSALCSEERTAHRHDRRTRNSR